MTNWKSATCEACIYRVGDKCRRHPPTYADHAEVISGYPFAKDEEGYNAACAEYTEEGQPTPFERAVKLAVDKGAVAAMQAMTDSLR